MPGRDRGRGLGRRRSSGPTRTRSRAHDQDLTQVAPARTASSSSATRSPTASAMASGALGLVAARSPRSGRPTSGWPATRPRTSSGGSRTARSPARPKVAIVDDRHQRPRLRRLGRSRPSRRSRRSSRRSRRSRPTTEIAPDGPLPARGDEQSTRSGSRSGRSTPSSAAWAPTVGRRPSSTSTPQLTVGPGSIAPDVFSGRPPPRTPPGYQVWDNAVVGPIIDMLSDSRSSCRRSRPPTSTRTAIPTPTTTDSRRRPGGPEQPPSTSETGARTSNRRPRRWPRRIRYRRRARPGASARPSRRRRRLRRSCCGSRSRRRRAAPTRSTSGSARTTLPETGSVVGWHGHGFVAMSAASGRRTWPRSRGHATQGRHCLG